MSVLVALPIGDTGRFEARVDATAEVQRVFDARRAALNARDLAALRELHDASRGPYTACALERARIAFALGRDAPRYRVIRTQPYRGYLRTYATAGGDVFRFYMRQISGRWVFTEPAPDELGEERILTGENVRLLYWSIDEEIAVPLLEATSYARSYALLSAPAPKDRELQLRILPTRETGSSIPCAAGAAARISGEPFEIRALSGDLSDASGIAPAVSTISRRTLIHEALHWAQALAAPRSIGRSNWWLIEGWPTLLATGESLLGHEFPRIGCGDLPTYAQLGSGPGLAHGAPGHIVQRYYVYAASAVRYLTERSGADDAYWRLLRAYEAPGTADEVFQAAVGTTAVAFRDGWAAWVAERYCR